MRGIDVGNFDKNVIVLNKANRHFKPKKLILNDIKNY